ncbi:hypothetical protein [Streptomyces sp. NPDC056883]|uniref:hypothetical protein n=1 Tax=Streptomyces sp. NPDC056883 TaxID=3345959 RepID=UPI0036899B5F
MSTPTRTAPANTEAEFARAVAAELGPQWSPRPATWPGRFQLVDGRGGRLVLLPGIVRGLLPDTKARSLRHGPSPPEIGVTPRSPRYVAGHIRRRLLPRYAAARDEQQALIQAQRTEQRERARVAQQIADRLAATAPDICVHPDAPYRRQTTVTGRRGVKAVSVSAVVGASGAEVSLTIDGLNAEQASAITELLTRLG